MFPNSSETGADGRGARGGALGGGEQGEELGEWEGAARWRWWPRPALGEDKVREEDGWSFQSTHTVEGGPIYQSASLFTRHVSGWEPSARWIGWPTFSTDVAHFFWWTWSGFHYIEFPCASARLASLCARALGINSCLLLKKTKTCTKWSE
jgi:hypothetical protein